MNVDGIRVLDATLRDGGLVNDFFFDDKFVKALYRANIEAGVDYMEFGYRASKKQFDTNAFGKWKFTSDADVWEVIGEKDPRMKLSIMVDVGRTDFREDIGPRKDSPIDLFRVATYIETIPEAVEMINYISSLGYETTCNIMAISKCTDEQIAESIRAAYEETGYLCDPHGAVGYRALCEGLKEGEVGVFLETAHPAKFLATVEKIIGKEVEIPAKLAAFMEGTKQSVSMSKDFADFKAFLMKQ